MRNFLLFSLLTISLLLSACGGGQSSLSPDQAKIQAFMSLPEWQRLFEPVSDLSDGIHLRFDTQAVDTDGRALIVLPGETKDFRLSLADGDLRPGYSYIVADTYTSPEGNSNLGYSFNTWVGGDLKPAYSFNAPAQVIRHYWYVMAKGDGNPEWAAYNIAVRYCIDANIQWNGVFFDCRQLIAQKQWSTKEVGISIFDSEIVGDKISGRDLFGKFDPLYDIISEHVVPKSDQNHIFVKTLYSDEAKYLNTSNLLTTAIVVNATWLTEINNGYEYTHLVGDYHSTNWSNYVVNSSSNEISIELQTNILPDTTFPKSTFIVFGYANPLTLQFTTDLLGSTGCDYAAQADAGNQSICTKENIP